MKEALLKKRLGIPAALLILLVSAGVATAFVVENFTYTVNAAEPLSFTEVNPLKIDYQGDADNIIVQATNVSEKTAYGILVDADVTKGQVDSITYGPEDQLVNTEQKVAAGGKDVNGDGDKWDAWYNIGRGFNYKIVVTVDTPDDVKPENLEVKFAFHRTVEY